MFNFLNPYTFWLKIAGVVILMAGASATTYYIKNNADTVKLQKVQLAYSQAQTANVTASLTQLQGFIASMHAADANYGAALDSINAQFAKLKKDLANAKLNPLPVDCKPDVGRLRVLTGAVAAANQGAGAGK